MLTEDANVRANAEDSKPQEVEKIDRMEEGGYNNKNCSSCVNTVEPFFNYLSCKAKRDFLLVLLLLFFVHAFLMLFTRPVIVQLQELNSALPQIQYRFN